MPKIYLDDMELNIEDRDNNSTIGELVKTLEGEMASHRRFIHQLWIEGRNMEIWREEEVLKQPLSACQELRLVSADYEVLFEEAICVLKEYMATVKENIEATSKKIRVGEVSTGDYLSAIFTHINEIVRTISALRHNRALSHRKIFKEDPEQFYPELLKIMEELKKTFEQKDIVLLADIFEYELLPFLNKMSSAIFHPAEGGGPSIKLS